MKASEFDRAQVAKDAKLAALWSTPAAEDVEYEMLDEKFSIEDVHGHAEEKLTELINKFFDAAGDLLEEYPMDEGQLGHDLIMTTNGHGVGFWDRGLGDLGDKLTEICDTLPEYNLYVGDDGKLYAE